MADVNKALNTIKRVKMHQISGHVSSVFNAREIAFLGSCLNSVSKVVEDLITITLDQQARIDELEKRLKGATADGKDP